MRELKFRAWDKTQNKYIIPQRLALDDDGALDFYIYNSGGYALECFIVEQYTGLKDKNDKEIYIGDIVSEHQGDIVGEIVQKPSGEYHISWVGIFGGEPVLYDHLSLCEVIGNIHENPELIEKER